MFMNHSFSNTPLKKSKLLDSSIETHHHHGNYSFR